MRFVRHRARSQLSSNTSPREVSLTQGNPFKLNGNVLIAYPENNALLQRNAEFLSEYIRQSTGYAPKTKAIAAGEQVKNAITLGLDPDIANKEGYVLTTTPEGISINGQTENGVFYGIQTLRKSIPAEAKGATILIPAGEIKDEPRFSYRGMHLDVGRHFFPIEFIKRVYRFTGTAQYEYFPLASDGRPGAGVLRLRNIRN